MTGCGRTPDHSGAALDTPSPPSQADAAGHRRASVRFADGGLVTLSDWVFVYEFGSSAVQDGLRTYQPQSTVSHALALPRTDRGVESVTLLGPGQLRSISFQWPAEGDGLLGTVITTCDGATIDGGRLEAPSAFLTKQPYTFAQKVFLEGTTVYGRFRKHLQFQADAGKEVTPRESVHRVDFDGCDGKSESTPG
jgi:hypothetical protein